MKDNVGVVDRIVRLVAGLALIAWGLGYIPDLGDVPSWGWVAAVAGGVFALTALLGSCPMYSLLGISTCRTRT